MALGFPLSSGKRSAWNSEEEILALCYTGRIDAGPARWSIFGVSSTLLKMEVGGRAGYKEDYQNFSKLNTVKYLNSSLHLVYQNEV